MTRSGGKQGRNPALQQAPDLILANPLSCRPWLGEGAHRGELGRSIRRRSSFWPRLLAITLIDTHPLGSSGGLFRAQRTLLATTIQVRQQCPGPQATG
jgi:hypothetical protein